MIEEFEADTSLSGIFDEVQLKEIESKVKKALENPGIFVAFSSSVTDTARKYLRQGAQELQDKEIDLRIL